MASRAAGVLSALAFALALASGQAIAQPPTLKIVVLAGEDAVNVIKQKTAVQPLVEVRDRNNLPVPGAVVTFTMAGGQHAVFAGGLQTLTITTNAAGQAAAAGISPLTTGAFQIQVQAAFQGQVATAAITQTNFATAAAAAAGNASGASSGAAAGGGGGGISGTTIGVVGAAVAGGAVVAAKELGGGDGSGDANGGKPGSPTTFTGPVSGQFDMSTTTASSTGSTTCVSTRAINGTLTMNLVVQKDGSVTGNAQTGGTLAEIAFTSSQFCSPLPGSVPFAWSAPVTGSTSNMVFSGNSSGTGPTPGGGGSVTSNTTTSFVGSLSNGVITGTLTYTDATNGTNQVGPVASTITGRGSVSMPITLR